MSGRRSNPAVSVEVLRRWLCLYESPVAAPCRPPGTENGSAMPNIKALSPILNSGETALRYLQQLCAYLIWASRFRGPVPRV